MVFETNLPLVKNSSSRYFLREAYKIAWDESEDNKTKKKISF